MRSPSILVLALVVLLRPPETLSGEDLLDPTLVTADALPEWVGRDAYAVEFLDEAEIQAMPRPNLDSILRQQPGFRLFRRSGSETAHPTTQGLSLRNVGPNGASRTEVYLDGIPQNDPFGGWINWTRLPPSSLSQVTIIRDGGVNPWGRDSVGGTLSIQRRWPEASSILLEGKTGTTTRYDSLITGNVTSKTTGTQIMAGGHFANLNGYHVIHSSQRGPVDRKAGHETRTGWLNLRQPLNDFWTMDGGFSLHHHNRNNGTRLQTNESEALDWHLRLEGENQTGSFRQEWTLYHQSREFSSQFSAVTADRTSERAVLDQYRVPATAIGFSNRSRLQWDRHLLTFGTDFRQADGKTHERFRNLGEGFTRLRVAGGEQWNAGMFLMDSWDATEAIQLHLGARLN
ncbi:MAG: TonB-dependent receptor, partial [Verrucomicrobiota bacterium]